MKRNRSLSKAMRKPTDKEQNKEEHKDYMLEEEDTPTVYDLCRLHWCIPQTDLHPLRKRRISNENES
jgi:hypothetical protein